MNKFFVAVAVLIISTNCFADNKVDFQSAAKAYEKNSEPKAFVTMMNALGAMIGDSYLENVKQGKIEDSEKKRSEVSIRALGGCNEFAMKTGGNMLSQVDPDWNSKVDKAIQEGILSCRKTFDRAVGN